MLRVVVRGLPCLETFRLHPTPEQERTHRCHQAAKPVRFALEADAIVALQNWFVLPAISARQASIPLTYGRRDMRYLVTAGFASVGRAAECVQLLEKERTDKILVGGGVRAKNPAAKSSTMKGAKALGSKL